MIRRIDQYGMIERDMQFSSANVSDFYETNTLDQVLAPLSTV